MPYSKQIQKLIGDGINLLPPSDLIAEGECENCENFRPDQAGKLVSRWGTIALTASLGTRLHTIAVAEALPDPSWYLGVDTSLHNYQAVMTTLQVTDAITAANVVTDGDYLGWASMHSYLWLMNKSVQGYVLADKLYPWLPAAPSTAPSVAKTTGNRSGAVKYYVTFATAREYESNPTTIADVITATAEISDTSASFGVTLSSIPVSTNPHVTKRHIYCVGGLLPAPYRVRTIDDNTTTSVTDDGGDTANDDEADLTSYFLTDAQAIDVGYLMEDDHDPPPEAFGLAGPYNERLIAFNTTANPNRVWYTPAGEPWRFRGSSSDDGDWVDLGDEVEPIYAVSVKKHFVIFYKKKSIWRLVGDFADGIIEEVTDKTGIKGPCAWAPHGNVDYFRGNEGIYLMTGAREIKVSEKVDPIFKGFISNVASPILPADTDEWYWEQMAIQNDRLYHAYVEAS